MDPKILFTFNRLAALHRPWKYVGCRTGKGSERICCHHSTEAPHQPEALREYRPAASIYENMIKPVIPFAIRGNIWYQGENNEDRAEQYGILLPTMIRASVSYTH